MMARRGNGARGSNSAEAGRVANEAAPTSNMVDETRLAAVHEPVVACYGSLVVFVVLLSSLLFLHGVMGQYSMDVMPNIGRRYSISQFELDFILGVERIGFVMTLLFIAFYGNRIHKPRAIGAGGLLAGLGAILCAVSYFITGNRPIEESVSVFVEAGLCGSDKTVEGEDQCYFLPISDDKTLAFSLLSLGMFFVGLGGACFATTGLLFIEENAKKHQVAVLLGICLSMRGLGQCLGTLLATWFSQLNEAPRGRARSIYAQEIVGAWWLGFVFLSSLFVIVGLLFMPFPRWISEPEWSMKRRQQISEYKQYKEERRRLRVTSTKVQRHGSPSGHDKNHRRQKDKQNRVDDKERRHHKHDKEKSGKNTDRNKNMNDKRHHRRKKDEERNKNTAEALDEPHHVDGDAHDAVHVSIPDNLDKVGKHEETNGSASVQNGSATEPLASDNEMEKDDGRQHRHKRKRRKRPSKKREKIKRPKRARKEKIKDLPRSLWSLLKNPVILLSLLGITFASYVPTGYTATLPKYLQIQFLARTDEANFVTGVSSHLASGIGALIGGVIIFKRRMNMLNALIMMLVSLALCIMFQAVLMAINCTVPPISHDLGQCADSCVCSDIQYEPVCGSDGVTYLSSCHAGCRQVTASTVSAVLNFTNCDCAGGTAWSGTCGERCWQLWPFAVVVFLAFTTLAMGQVPVVLIFLRSVKDRGKSLSLGFAVWVVYLIAFVPAPVVFNALGASQCLLHQENCLEEEVCWDYDRPKYNYITNGVAVAFQTGALVCFFIVWLVLRRGGFRATNDETDPETGRAKNSNENAVNSQDSRGRKDGDKSDPHKAHSNQDKNKTDQQPASVSRAYANQRVDSDRGQDQPESMAASDLDLSPGQVNSAYGGESVEMDMVDGKPSAVEELHEGSEKL